MVRGRGVSSLVEALLAAVLSLVGVGAVRMSTYATCYIMSPLFHRRTPEMVQEQRELLTRYHDRGVINDGTYRKSLDALENPLGLKATEKKGKE